MEKYEYETYDDYLTQQKQHKKTRDRTKRRKDIRKKDIEAIKSCLPKAKSVLCIGCRHEMEINDFKKAGFSEVVGIDLFSDKNNIIQVMDMKDIKKNFKENQFDIVYMSHSLEHSYDPQQVIKDIECISKYGLFAVLPIKNKPDKKDPVLLDCMKNPSEEQTEQDFKELFNSNIQLSYYRQNKKIKNSIGKEFSFLIEFV